jgi:ubiquinone/menaquinone biosynthesis C-methylase UbiE
VKFQRSSHLSWFRRGAAAFLYHDGWGFLLEMSADLKAFVDAFADGAEPGDAARMACIPQSQVPDFVQVFRSQHVLVAPGTEEDAARWDAVPLKGPWPLVVHPENALPYAVVSRGFGWEPSAQPRMLPFDDVGAQLWASVDGAQTVRELAGSIGKSLGLSGEVARDRTLATVLAWTHHDAQLVKLLVKPRGRLSRLPPYASSTLPYAPWSDTAADADAVPTGAERDLAAYHEQTLADAEAQFEEHETTLSHLFSLPHEALRGRTWAAAVLEAAVARGWWAGGPVVEVGGGTGRFAEGWLRAVRDSFPERWQELASMGYKVVELAPALRAAQTERLRAFAACARVEAGHAERLPLADASVGFLISNEVIADLRIAMVPLAVARNPVADADHAEALALLRAAPLDLSNAPDPVPVQVGSAAFLREIARVLAVGATAVLTEFGAPDAFPLESTHLDHAEWSVQFRPLYTYARTLGLDAEIVPVSDLVDLRADVTVLATTRTQFRNLRWLLAKHGVALPKRAVTPQELASRCARQGFDLLRVEGLQWTPCGERVMGLRPAEFWALAVTKAGHAAAPA